MIPPEGDPQLQTAWEALAEIHGLYLVEDAQGGSHGRVGRRAARGSMTVCIRGTGTIGSNPGRTAPKPACGDSGQARLVN